MCRGFPAAKDLLNVGYVLWLRRLRLFRHLSPSIAPKRKFLAVDLTVTPAYPDKESCKGSELQVPETIEWE
jgi:hypothetical protein